MNRRNTPRISFIGFGEAGQAIASGLRESGIERIAAWDILFPQAGRRAAQSGRRKIRRAAGVVGCRRGRGNRHGHLGGDRGLKPGGGPLGRTASFRQPLLSRHQFGLARPQAGNGDAAWASDARYVDVAVVAAIHPKRHRTPLLIAGPQAEAVAPLLRELDMRAQGCRRSIGGAAAIKMIRRVMIKGIEALTLECFLAAARAGVLDEVTASLKNNYPGLDWAKLSEYNLERMASHGERRAAEMEESAATLRELGLDPLMVEATVRRQREMGAIGKDDAVRQSLDQGRSAILSAIDAAKK